VCVCVFANEKLVPNAVVVNHRILDKHVRISRTDGDARSTVIPTHQGLNSTIKYHAQTFVHLRQIYAGG